MTTVVSVAQGGTGSNSAALARTALGVPPSAAYDQANTARDQANTARTQANSAYSDANTRLSASGGTLAGDLIITGNLTVSGNSTTLNAEILTIEDADIVLLSNVASTPALNAGIIVNRGTSTNTFLRWDEVTDKWGWSDDGSTTYKFTSALDAYAQANSAYGAANNRVLKAGDTMTGQLNISAGGLLVTGNVGFGTASPSRILHLSSSGTDCGIRIDNTTSARPALLLYDDSQNLSIINSSDTGYIAFINGTGAGTERVRIANTGNVGIGTTSPNVKLDIIGTNAGSLRLSSTTADAANKLGRIVGRPYTNADTDFLAFDIRGLSALNEINYGGGSVILNAVNSHKFYTAANNTTLGGTERMIIDPSGNVGIGTTAPYSQLHLTGDVTMGSGNNARPALKITNWGYSASYRALLIGSSNTTYTTANTGAVTVCFNYDPSVNGNGSFNGDGREIIFRRGTRFVTPNSGDTAFNLTNLVLYDGNVGIGTDTPRGNLDVGTATASAITRSIHLGYSAADFYGFRLTNFNTAASFGAGNFLIQRGTTAAWVDDFAIDNNGNVGIGTTSPATLLDVRSVNTSGATGATIRVGSQNHGGDGDEFGNLEFYWGDPDSAEVKAKIFAKNVGNVGPGGGGAADLLFATRHSASGQALSERMRITTGGAIGVNYTNPAGYGQLTVSFSATNSANNNGVGLAIRPEAETSDAYFALFFNSTGAGIGSIRRVGTTNAVAYNTSSDRRLKENIVPAQSASNIIDNIEVVQYDWKEGTHVRHGIIAQDLYNVAPEAVSVGDSEEIENPRNPWGVDYSKLVPMLIKELQAVRARLNALESK